MKKNVSPASQRCIESSQAFLRHLGNRSEARTMPHSTEPVSMTHETMPADRERYHQI